VAVPRRFPIGQRAHDEGAVRKLGALLAVSGAKNTYGDLVGRRAFKVVAP
jgi:hypothetical protein